MGSSEIGTRAAQLTSGSNSLQDRVTRNASPLSILKNESEETHERNSVAHAKTEKLPDLFEVTSNFPRLSTLKQMETYILRCRMYCL